MKNLTLKNFPEYELIDTGEGMRLEKFGQYTIARPDPQILWEKHADEKLWQQADAVFDAHQSGDKWVTRAPLPEHWPVHFQDLTFNARLTPFKHTGIFPEQAVMWEWSQNLIRNAKRKINVLNLFGYTGIASVAAAKAGANVTHLDASKPAITWANENMKASGLPGDSIRWILDDAVKFTRREMTRGNTYDAIIMDPPVYGHGPHNEPWDFYKHVPVLLQQCSKILSKNPLFFLINAYAISASSTMLGNILEDIMSPYDGSIEYGELTLKESQGNRLLSTGIYGRWEARC